MKSINVKKIAAITAGAVLIGASLLAAAPVMFGNTEIINAQGKPVVQVVVGANSQPSDGVAAANIAAVIGSLAYQSQTVSAQLTGSANCTATGSSATGACTLSNKAVTLDITTPGTASVSGGYGFTTYGWGFINNNVSGEDYQTVNGAAREITGDDLSAFADYTSPSVATLSNVVTSQNLYVQTKSAPSFYTDVNQYKVQLQPLVYVISFQQPTYNGIPACLLDTVLSSNVSQTMTNCTPTDSYLTSQQRLMINYLGQQWVISAMAPDQSPTSIKLAQEATSAQVVHVGGTLPAGAYTVKLDDLTTPASTGASQAIVTIYDQSNATLLEDTVSTGVSKQITLPNGDMLTLYVYNTAPGMGSAANRWAEMAVFSNELTLTNSQLVDDGANANWTVNLGWTNYSGGVNKWVLKNITLTRQATGSLAVGDSINILESPSIFQLKFAGMTMTDAQRDQLSVDYTPLSSYYDFAVENNGNIAAISDNQVNYVCFTSQNSPKAFQFSGATPAATSDANKFCVGVGGVGPLLYQKTNGNMVRWVPSASGNTLNISTDTTHQLVFDGSNFVATGSVGNNMSLTRIGAENSTWGTPSNSVSYRFGFKNSTNWVNDTDGYLYVLNSTNDSALSGHIGSYVINASGMYYIVDQGTYMPSSMPYPFNVQSVSIGYNIQEQSTDNANIAVSNVGNSFSSGDLVSEVSIYEYLNAGGSSTTTALAPTKGAFSFAVDATSGKFVESNVSNNDNELDVTYLPSGSNATQVTSQKVGFYSQRGSVLESISDTNILLTMAKQLGVMQYYLQPTGANVSAGTVEKQLTEGQQTSVQQSTVAVKSISATGTSAVSGGNAACTADTSGMQAVLSVAGAPTSAMVSMPYTFAPTDRLVVLDSDAPTTESLILVGGPMVNTLTAQAIAGTNIQLSTPGTEVHTAVSDQRIVVAGYTAADTTAAADQFISQLLANAAAGTNSTT